jgi:hypothetical protein
VAAIRTHMSIAKGLGAVALLALLAVGCAPSGTMTTTESAPVDTSGGASLPAAEGTVEESAEEPDAPTATAVGKSLDNPVPVGQAGEVGKWSVEVIGWSSPESPVKAMA